MKKEIVGMGMERRKIFEIIARYQPDVLIIGAGINGIGTFRDLSLQGVRSLLVDRGDFCSGASAASSRMAHGGIRYLENGEFRLVREAVQERNRMIRNAPHLVKPLPTTIPIFKYFSGLFNAPLKFLGLLDKPSERGALVIKIGLLFYDSFTGRQRSVPRHIFINRGKSLQKFPLFNPRVRFTATYHDGNILSPERLALEILLDALAEGEHAQALNYATLEIKDGRQVIITDAFTGQKAKLEPRVIINATGPWIDSTNRLLGIDSVYIGPTKGSHLVLDNPRLRQAIGDHEFFFENRDGRIVLIFPLFDKVMIGTSDLPIADPDSARCTPEEEDYFIEMINRVFPSLEVRRDQIVFRFSGVRPLAYSHSKSAGQTTRDHHIHEDRWGDVPVLSLVGGKWTSYRAFSEQATDRVLAILNTSRRGNTRDLAIGERSFPGLIKSSAELDQGAILRIVRDEMVVHLDDLILRRTLLGYLGRLSPGTLQELSSQVGKILGWNEETRVAELNRTLEILADRHGVRFTS